MSYKVALIADNHFIEKDGKYYVNGTYTKQYLSRFTSNFDELVIIARGRSATENDDITKLRETGGERVTFALLEDFYGVQSYILKRKALKTRIDKVLDSVDAVFIRMPCILTTVALKCAKENHLPMMIDVGADPDSIYRSSKNDLFQTLISKYLKRVCKQACLSANGVSYVTKHILQKKYPCTAMIQGESVERFTAAISNVDISEDSFYRERNYTTPIKPLRILHISNNIEENSGKGHEECLQVLSKLSRKGVDAQITFLGDGDGIKSLKQKANVLKVADKVIFKGRIADREEYRNIILSNDLFLFPSHSEGLPRVLIEVMATGMVCISSNVDGIPEILEKENIFNYSDTDAMTKRILELINDAHTMNAISNKNLKVARRYSNTNLKKEYDLYYSKVRRLIDTKEY